MANVGQLLVMRTNSGVPVARGKVQTWRARFGFSMEPIREERSSDKAPTHALMMKSEAGEMIQVGVAWQREITRGERAGQPMFGLAFSDPDLPEWTGNLAAFPTGERDDAGEIFRITHERPRADVAKPQAEAA